MADISTIKPHDRTIEINHPGNGLPVGLRVSIMSFDDDRLKKIRRSITDEKLTLERKGKGFKAEQIEDNGNRVLFGAMTGWEWYDVGDGDGPLTFKGETPEFNQRNVYAVFHELPWVKSQIDTEVAEEKDFFDK